MSNPTVEQDNEITIKENTTLDCGIIMPIASMTSYPESHWAKVKDIIIEAAAQVDGYKFSTRIVSETNGETHVIHKTIIQNLYNSEIVVCDISGKNPNVLFELGMRLAFDKPTILIRDDQTDFMFDTGVIEHMTYPKSLSYPEVVKFKNDLAIKIKTTYEKKQHDPDYSAFLRNFGKFEIAQLDQEKVSDANQIILNELNNINKRLSHTQSEKIKFKKRPIIPSNLKKTIENYINEYNDYEDPDIVQYKEEFVSYLSNNINIDLNQIPDNVITKYIKTAQRLDDLPF